MANLNRIRTLCESKKVPIKELAEKCGLTPQSIYDAINRNSTKTEYLEKIAQVLEVPVSYFFDAEPRTYKDFTGNLSGFADTPATYTTACQGCKDKQKIIRLLEDKINMLEDKLEKYEGNKAKKVG